MSTRHTELAPVSKDAGHKQRRIQTGNLMVRIDHQWIADLGPERRIIKNACRWL